MEGATVMESSTIEESTAVEEVEGQPLDRSQQAIFEFNGWVHVGEGAMECDHRENGRCKVETHFHAWVRLPNKFQVTAIREKAQAARARVLRQAKDPDSDRSAIIDNQLGETAILGREVLVEELTIRNENKWTQRAMSEIAEGEEGADEESEFAHIEDDQTRFAELSKLDPEERDEGEYQELVKHLEKWNDEVEAQVRELRQPELDALADKDDEELERMVRQQIVAEQANQVFMRVFAKWQYTLCSLTERYGATQVFQNLNKLETAAPEVIDALEEAFKALESRLMQRDSLRAEGN